MKRIVAYVLRFITNARPHRQASITGLLSVDELRAVERTLIIHAQKQMFPCEYYKLANNLPILDKRNSKISGLSIFLDKNDVIRVGGRLSNTSEFSYNKKHPVLLCSKHRFTELLFQDEHRKLLHAGPQLLLGTVRECWWPLAGRNLARRTVKQCVTCARMTVYDASFRVPQGVLQGNLIHYGNYHQCLAIDQQLNDTNHIRGKHCMITVDDLTISLPDAPWGLERHGAGVNMTMVRAVVGELRKYERVKKRMETDLGRTGTLPAATFRLAICIPAACTTQEVLGDFLDHRPGLCRLAGDKPRRAADYVAIVVFSLIGLVTIISTAYDVRHTIILAKDPKELNKLYSCASVYTNTRNLFTFSSRPGALTCLDGIRTMSILWVIIGHTLINLAIAGIQNGIEMYQWYVSGKAIWIQAADISVDSFFLLSGMLLVYASANKLTGVGLLKSLHLFYLNRLLRMFPILAAAVLLQASFLNRITDGANWGWQAIQVENCRRYWWSALLHIQNYYNSEYMCLPHTWYLSVDVQLHILSPIVLFWVLRGRRSGWAGVGLGFLLSLTAATLYVFLVVSQPDKVYKLHYYENTLTRAPVFLLGMIYGYILHIYRNKKVELAHWQVTIGWLASLLCLGGSTYAFHPPLQEGFDSQLYLNMLYAFNRSVWAAGLGWLVLACVYGYAGPLNWLLSLTVFKFLARISYAMYIFHYPIQFIWNSAAISTSYFSVANIMWQCTTDVAATVAVSTLVTVVIDAPFSTLQRILFGTGSQKPKTKGSLVDKEKNGVLTTKTHPY